MFTHRYIHLKSNPLAIKASGYVEQGGLGNFNKDLFVEVEGPLPDGAFDYTPLTVGEELDEAFKSLPAALRGAFYPLKAAVKLALEQDDYEAAAEIIAQAKVPPGYEAFQQSMLMTLAKEA